MLSGKPTAIGHLLLSEGDERSPQGAKCLPHTAARLVSGASAPEGHKERGNCKEHTSLLFLLSCLLTLALT